MDIYESLKKLKTEENREEAESHFNKANVYASQGFCENSIAELLQLDGCSREVSHKLASSSYNNVPVGYESKEVPFSYLDVKSKVENSILQASRKDLTEYFEMVSDVVDSDVLDRLLYARDSHSPILIEEVHNELKPHIEDTILRNNAVSKKVEASLPERREELEHDLFGIWPVYYIQKHDRMIKAEQKFLRKVDEKEIKHGRR